MKKRKGKERMPPIKNLPVQKKDKRKVGNKKLFASYGIGKVSNCDMQSDRSAKSARARRVKGSPLKFPCSPPQLNLEAIDEGNEHSLDSNDLSKIEKDMISR